MHIQFNTQKYTDTGKERYLKTGTHAQIAFMYRKPFIAATFN